MSDSVEPGSVVDRETIVGDLAACAADLAGLVATASPAELRAPSDGTAWTNEELLFHMVFGFLVVRRLLRLVRLVSSLPPWVGRTFARLLESGTVPFHRVNYVGARGGALVFRNDRLTRLSDRTIERLIHSLRTEPERRLHRGMPFPVGWDPYFQPVMTLADVYAYPVLHYRHHRAQLTLSATGPSVDTP